jgi:hypothetical protein
MASSLPFYELCQNLEKIVKVKNARERSTTLREFMNNQRARIAASEDPEVCIFRVRLAQSGK